MRRKQNRPKWLIDSKQLCNRTDVQTQIDAMSGTNADSSTAQSCPCLMVFQVAGITFLDSAWKHGVDRGPGHSRRD